MPIPEETLQRIKERSDIVRVVGEYVSLQKAGQNYKGLCPFHSEKTPSFMVSPSKGIYHCFGCGVGGNVFNFIMKFKGLSFPEAVKFLGNRVGIDVVSTQADRRAAGKTGRLREVIARAAKQFETNLHSPVGRSAKHYLTKREIPPESIETFHLGFAPESWDNMLNLLVGKGYNPKLIEEAGLIVAKRQGTGYYDRFRNRIMFPIQDTIGRFIGFGGRTMQHDEKETPKYINTSESALFHKGENLYGLFQAEEHIRKRDHVYVVEGYVDVIQMYAQGLQNTVAPLGTALTNDQVALMLRYTRNIYLLFDPDEAGVKAAMRSTSIMHQHRVDPMIIRLPAEHDPGNFFNTYTMDEFELLKRDSISGIDFIIMFFAGEKKEYTAHEIISMLNSLSGYFDNMSDELFKEDFLTRLSRVLHTEKGILRRELSRLTGKRSTPHKEQKPMLHAERGIQTELYLLLLLLSNPEYYDLAAPRIDEDYFHGKWTRRLWRAIGKAEQQKGWNSATVFNYIDDEQFVKYLSGKLVEEVLNTNPKEQLIDTIATLKELRLREKLEQLSREIQKAELEDNEELETKLLVEKNAFTNELKKIEKLRAHKVHL
jgi:DNA primase